MLIEKTREITKQDIRRTDSPRKSNAKFLINLKNSEPSQNTKLSNVQSNFISTIEGLGMQLISDKHEEILKKSKKILNMLKNLEVGILSGDVTKNSLENLSKMISKLNTEDEKLQQIFDEIQLRAKIEFAKYDAI